jgi:hypothetical protein
MKIAGRKASDFFPQRLRPAVRSLGAEGRRARIAARSTVLAARAAVGSGIAHVSGPARVPVGEREVVVLCLVRNGMAHLATFLRHYRRLGVAHVVFLDNGSSDGTVEYLSAQPSVSVFRSLLSFRRYEAAFKRWMVRRFGRTRGWCLVADADELFEYPYADVLPLPEFLRYLDTHGYDAVVAQNLEMIPHESIAAIQGRDVADLERTHRYYDLSDIRPVRQALWLDRNHVDLHDIVSHTGGIWESVFGYRGSMLTKQPLFRARGSVRVFPYNVHFVTGAHLADVTCVFRHYKYTGRFVAHVQEELQRRQHYGNAEVFEHYRRALERDADLTLYRSTARVYEGAAALLESGFLVASDRYRAWARERSAAHVA